MNKLKYIIVTTLLLSFPVLASAHQPKFVDKQTQVGVVDPEVSKAYYGELTGKPAVYTIESAEKFKLYVGILSPELKNAQTNYKVEVKDGAGRKLVTLNDPQTEWKRWYEEFAGDWYLEGPDFKTEAGAGNYTITVSNPTNTGKYVLAVGELEVFGGKDSFNTMSELYKTKTIYFEKPFYSIFQGKIGNGLLIAALAIIVLVALLIYFFRRKRKRKTK